MRISSLPAFAVAASLMALTLVSCGQPQGLPHAGIDTVTDNPVTPVVSVEASDFDTEAMDALLQNSIDSGEVIGVSALIFDDGQVVYEGAFGLRDRERETPAELDTIWRIYSMTKPVTSVLIMDLIEDGKLSLSDPASKYLPELADMKVAAVDADGALTLVAQDPPMTIEDLLLHRAGFAYGIFGDINPVEALYMKAKLFDQTSTGKTKLEKVYSLPLLAQPGTSWYYSLSIDVLGVIAERITGQTLEEAMKARIFTPLGMDETRFRVTETQKPRFASNYILKENGRYDLMDDGQTSPFLKTGGFQSGGGGLVSTLGDYAKFAQMMLDGGIYNGHRVLDEATVEMMTQDQMDADDVYLFPWLGEKAMAGFGYGGSVQTGDTPELLAATGRAEGQYGWSGAAGTKFWIDEKNDMFGIIMMQFFNNDSVTLPDRIRALAYAETHDTP